MVIDTHLTIVMGVEALLQILLFMHMRQESTINCTRFLRGNMNLLYCGIGHLNVHSTPKNNVNLFLCLSV